MLALRLGGVCCLLSSLPLCSADRAIGRTIGHAPVGTVVVIVGRAASRRRGCLLSRGWHHALHRLNHRCTVNVWSKGGIVGVGLLRR